MIIANRASTILYQFLKFIRRDDKKHLLIPSNICVDVLFVLLKTRIPFKFLDINNQHSDLDFNISILNDKMVFGLLYNHVYGNENTPIEKFRVLKEIDPNFIIIDDRCLCEPLLEYENNKYVNLTIFSTGPKKQLDLGKYGYGYCSDQSFELKFSNTYKYESLDRVYQIFKSNFQIKNNINLFRELKGDWLDERIPDIKIDDYIELIKKNKVIQNKFKQKLKDLYSKLIPKELQYMDDFQNWRFNIKCRNKKEILEYLFNSGLFASDHYYPLSLYCFQSTENCSIVYENTINLFIDHYYTEEKAIETSEVIKKYAIPL